jgi:hypothetical protein
MGSVLFTMIENCDGISAVCLNRRADYGYGYHGTYGSLVGRIGRLEAGLEPSRCARGGKSRLGSSVLPATNWKLGKVGQPSSSNEYQGLGTSGLT